MRYLLTVCLIFALGRPVLAADFIRADSNDDGIVDVSDVIQSLAVLYGAALRESPTCVKALDANDDGQIDIADPVSTLLFLFEGDSRELPSPFPDCGSDPTPDALSCDSFSQCPPPISPTPVLTPTRLRVEYLDNPLGVDTLRPRLSWALSSPSRGARQGAYQILAASSRAMLDADVGDLWDSDFLPSGRSVHILYAGQLLVSRQRVHWKVRVADQNLVPSAWSEPAWWEMGLLGEAAWRAEWINGAGDGPPDGQVGAPLVRRTFQVDDTPIARARVYVAGLGLYELRLNGEKVGDHVLDPAFTHYDRRSLYVVYDVTAQIRPGANGLGVILGNGWFNLPTRAVFEFDQAPWRMSPRLRLELHLEYVDGKTQRILSDGNWKVSQGPITYNSLRGGESYDARLAQPGWDAPGFDDAAWTPAQIVSAPQGALVAQTLPPMRVVESILLSSVAEPQPGVYVCDFGRNIAGWVRIQTEGTAGSTITLRYGERLLPDGTIDQTEIGSLIFDGRVQTDQYTRGGQGSETWEPRFTYHGFRYVQADGLGGPPDATTLVARVVHTDFDRAGSLASSNTLINEIYLASVASYESNFHGIPTDCPHREKMGWTGDALFAMDLGTYNFESATGYAKWLADIRDSQMTSGLLPPIVPTGGWGYQWGLLPVWNAAAIMIPWRLFVFYGDERVLEDNYGMMRRYLDFLDSFGTGADLVTQGIGDWSAPEPRTESAILSTIYFYSMATTMEKVATIIGLDADATHFASVAQRVRDAFDAEYLDASAYSFDKQTALSCVVHQGLATNDAAEEAIDRLAASLQAGDHRLDIGVVGSLCLLDALVDRGHGETAYRVATQTADPSWGHWIQQGATTLWEHWPGDHSQNHAYFGDIAAWFVRDLVGLRPDPSNPGFKHFIVEPGTFGDLGCIGTTLETLHGTVSVEWMREGGVLTLDVEVPANTSATLRLPAAPNASITEGGDDAASAPEVTYVGREGDREVYSIGSGRYSFEVTAPEAPPM